MHGVITAPRLAGDLVLGHSFRDKLQHFHLRRRKVGVNSELPPLVGANSANGGVV